MNKVNQIKCSEESILSHQNRVKTNGIINVNKIYVHKYMHINMMYYLTIIIVNNSNSSILIVFYVYVTANLSIPSETIISAPGNFPNVARSHNGEESLGEVLDPDLSQNEIGSCRSQDAHIIHTLMTKLSGEVLCSVSCSRTLCLQRSWGSNRSTSPAMAPSQFHLRNTSLKLSLIHLSVNQNFTTHTHTHTFVCLF